MENKTFRCYVCNGVFKNKYASGPILPFFRSADCQWCAHENRFIGNAKQNIINHYDLRCHNTPEELLEIEILRCKIRWVMAGKDATYITFKNSDMITQVNNSSDLRKALNENLHALLTQKRKLIVAKEVNNTLGKILSDVKMELMQNAITGDRRIISWFNESSKQLTQ